MSKKEHVTCEAVEFTDDGLNSAASQIQHKIQEFLNTRCDNNVNIIITPVSVVLENCGRDDYGEFDHRSLQKGVIITFIY